MAFELAHRGWEEAEADGAAAVAPVDAVDQRRKLSVLRAAAREQIRLVPAGVVVSMARRRRRAATPLADRRPCP